MRFSTTPVVLALTLVARLLNAQAPVDTLARLDSIVRVFRALGRANGEKIWPGFRPDTIPLMLSLPGRGNYLVGWNGALPAGYARVANADGAWADSRAFGAASTGTVLDQRPVAQVAITQIDPAWIASTAVHESFHVFEGVSRRPNRRFGQGENSFYVASYPVFDAENEAAIALEGKLLEKALAATSASERRRIARQFVSVRRARHTRVSPEIAQFDQMSEMNEGLAQYTTVRALELLGTMAPTSWKKSVNAQLASEKDRLTSLMGNVTQSFRLRYYATGPAMARMLDRLSTDWKSQLMRDNLTLQDALGLASGLDSLAESSRMAAEREFNLPQLQAESRVRIAKLQTYRRAQVDSVLARPGIRLVLLTDSLPGHSLAPCSFDPQNLLQVTSTLRLHSRYWRPCSGAVSAEFNVPSTQDLANGTIEAVIGNEADVKLSGDGESIALTDGASRPVTKFRLETPRVTVVAPRALLSRTGNVLRVVVIP